MKKADLTQMFSYELYQDFQNFFVIEHLRRTASYLERFLLRFWRHVHNWLWVGKCPVGGRFNNSRWSWHVPITAIEQKCSMWPNCMMSKSNAITDIFCSVEHTYIIITWQKRFLVIIIILCIDNNVVLIFNFLLVSSIDTNPFKALLKNDFNKVQKSIQEMRLPML